MNKDIKIIIGANYGDESKGLVTRHFVKQADNPIVIFHNGTAQRGHTVDYNPKFCHVYHHFGCGTGDGAPTFFAKTFWIHPMEFYREWQELAAAGITPECYCDPEAKIITPFDMLIDHITEDYITWEHQEPEHGSCGYGTWCATDRYPDAIYTVQDFYCSTNHHKRFMLESAWSSCLSQLIRRGVDIDKTPKYKAFFDLATSTERKNMTIIHFLNDLEFFFNHVKLIDFNSIYAEYNSLIFENAQGLGLDQNCGSEWHTTSNTGLTNPIEMLNDKKDFKAEVCYVSRAYTTRHGIGPMETEANKQEINADMVDRTNVTNEFQGSLRYGYPEIIEQKKRIEKDWNTIKTDKRFNKTIAITHCNEFPDFDNTIANYISYNPYSVLRN